MARLDLAIRELPFCYVRKWNCGRGAALLSAWFDDGPDIEVNEDVVGLGRYDKTLTVLFADELVDQEEDDQD